MSLPNVGVRMVVENDKAFKDALKDINDGLKINKAQMKLVAEQSKNMDDAQAALRSRMAALNDVLLSQKDKVAKLQEAYENSAAREGESSRVTMGWRTSLISAQTQLARTEGQLNSYNQQLVQSGSFGGQLGAKIQDLAHKFGITLPSGVNDAVSAMTGAINPSVLLGGAMTAAAAAAIKVYEAMQQLAQDGASWADNLLTNADKFGISAKQLQEFAYASDLVDVSSETLGSALAKLRVKIGDNDESLQNLAKASGVVIDTNGSAYDTFLQCIDALGKVTNENERASLAQDIFGRSYQELAPLIAKGSDALRAYGQEAEDNGIVLSDKQVQALGSLQDSYDRLTASVDAGKNKMAAELAPAMEDVNQVSRDYIGILGDLGQSALPVVADAIEAGAQALKSVEPVIDLVALSLEGVFSAIQSVITAISFLQAALDGSQASWDRFAKNYDRYQAIDNAIVSTGSRLDKSLGIDTAKSGTGYATGTTRAAAGAHIVGEQGPEMVYFEGGETVVNTKDARNMSAERAVNNWYVTIDAKNVHEFNDVVKIAQNQKTSTRQGVT